MTTQDRQGEQSRRLFQRDVALQSTSECERQPLPQAESAGPFRGDRRRSVSRQDVYHARAATQAAIGQTEAESVSSGDRLAS
jgi:hypothetical protein